MKIKETIERDCCQSHDMIKIGENKNLRDILQCVYCKRKVVEEWSGPGNNDFGWREYKDE